VTTQPLQRNGAVLACGIESRRTLQHAIQQRQCLVVATTPHRQVGLHPHGFDITGLHFQASLQQCVGYLQSALRQCSTCRLQLAVEMGQAQVFPIGVARSGMVAAGEPRLGQHQPGAPHAWPCPQQQRHQRQRLGEIPLRIRRHAQQQRCTRMPRPGLQDPPCLLRRQLRMPVQLAQPVRQRRVDPVSRRWCDGWRGHVIAAAAPPGNVPAPGPAPA